MTIMAMNLRLTDEQDRALAALAEAEGVSKNEAAGRAILERASRLKHERDVERFALEGAERYRSLLERLAE